MREALKYARPGDTPGKFCQYVATAASCRSTTSATEPRAYSSSTIDREIMGPFSDAIVRATDNTIAVRV